VLENNFVANIHLAALLLLAEALGGLDAPHGVVSFLGVHANFLVA